MRDWPPEDVLAAGLLIGLPVLGMVLYAVYRIAALFA